MTQITFNALNFCFPNDTMWVGAVAEIVGYSPSTNMHIVIDDGNCIGDHWTVHVYEPNDAKKHRNTWMSTIDRPYPIKHLGENESIKWIEESINFDSTSETIMLRDLIKKVPISDKIAKQTYDEYIQEN